MTDPDLNATPLEQEVRDRFLLRLFLTVFLCVTVIVLGLPASIFLATSGAQWLGEVFGGAITSIPSVTAP